MSIYPAIQYLRHRYNAKGRHGTHSPFVYAFVDHVVAISANENTLIQNIQQYFHFEEIIYHGTDSSENSITPPIKSKQEKETTPTDPLRIFKQLHIFPSPSGASHFLKEKPHLPSGDVILIRSLHNTKVHTQQWQNAKDLQAIKMSIDLFSIGLLFFRNEFKEKQHFILK